MHADPDTIDLREVARVLRRRWRWIAGGTLAGLLAAVAVLLLLPPRYESTATLLLRDGREGAAGFGGSGGSSEGGLSLSGLANILSVASGFETEIEILTSRSVVGAAVDSLGLQAQIRDPAGLAPRAFFSAYRFSPDLTEGTYHFQREGTRYRIRGPDGGTAFAAPGRPVEIGGAILTLRRADALPSEFEIRLLDRQEAIEQLRERIDAERAGGDVAELTFQARDPSTAAAVPNALVAKYLARRKTTDRGVNQHRYEFLAAHTDSIRSELANAAALLRRYQEESGVLDPSVYGEAELEQALELRARLEDIEVEARALRQVLDSASTGNLSTRTLAAYPTFLGNPAINNLLSNLLALESERTELLDRRTEQDPAVIVVDQQIRQLEDELVSLSTAYLRGLERQQAEIRAEQQDYVAALAALPAQAEAHYRAEREARRLSETLAALETELVQARLAAITEGGDIRLIDPAFVPDEPSFPKPFLTLAIGLFGGLMLGMFGAFGGHYLGNRVRDPGEAELAAGVPAVLLDPSTPLLLGGLNAERSTLLVLPVGARVDSTSVARRLVEAFAMRGERAVLAEFEGSSHLGLIGPAQLDPERVMPAGTGASLEVADPEIYLHGGGYFVYRSNGSEVPSAHPRAVVAELERRFSIVIAALPPLTRFPTPALLGPERPTVIAVRAGHVSRTELAGAVEALGRLGIAVPGVVVRNGADAESDAHG